MSRAAEPNQSASLLRVVAEAGKLGLGIVPVRLDDGCRKAVDADAAYNCSMGQFVKSIIFRVSGSDRHVLFPTAGENRVDPRKAGAIAGCVLEKADAGRIRRHTGFDIGGVSPIGHFTPIETLLDPELLAYGSVWLRLGTPRHVFEIDPRALPAALKLRIADLTAD